MSICSVLTTFEVCFRKGCVSETFVAVSECPQECAYIFIRIGFCTFTRKDVATTENTEADPFRVLALRYQLYAKLGEWKTHNAKQHCAAVSKHSGSINTEIV